MQDTTNATFLTRSITDNAALEFNTTSADIAFSGSLSGSGALTKTGNDALTLSGSNISYTGGTTITGGKLLLRDTTNATFRTKNITDNAALELNATASAVNYSGVISGSGALNISGSNTDVSGGNTVIVTLSGSTGNSYAGPTTVTSGGLILAKTSGYAIPGDLIIAGSTSFAISVQGNNEIPATANLTWNSTGSNQEFKLLGHSLTLASINDSTGCSVIENTWGESGVASSTLTVNNSANCSYCGYFRDSAGGSGLLSLVKNGSGLR